MTKAKTEKTNALPSSPAPRRGHVVLFREAHGWMKAQRFPGQRHWVRVFPTWLPLENAAEGVADLAATNDLTLSLAPVDLDAFEPDDFPDRNISVFVRDPFPNSTLWLRYAWANVAQRAYDCGRVGAIPETVSEAIAGIGAKTLRDDLWVRHDYRPDELLPL